VTERQGIGVHDERLKGRRRSCRETACEVHRASHLEWLELDADHERPRLDSLDGPARLQLQLNVGTLRSPRTVPSCRLQRCSHSLGLLAMGQPVDAGVQVAELVRGPSADPIANH
jgi:hypothetical protein